MHFVRRDGHTFSLDWADKMGGKDHLKGGKKIRMNAKLDRKT